MIIDRIRSFLTLRLQGLRRTPATALACVVFTSLSIATVHGWGVQEDHALRALMALATTVPLLFLAERSTRHAANSIKLALLALAVGSGLGLWAWVSAPPTGVEALRCGLVGLAAFLCLALLSRRDDGPFATWSELLLFHGAQAVLFAGVLASGISGALGAIHGLFDVEIPAKLWGDLWILHGSLLAPLFFLGSLPDPEAAEIPPPELPALRLAARFVLQPLTLLYLGILLAYAVRIALRRELPDGWVAGPVLACAGLGFAGQILSWRDRLEGATAFRRGLYRGFHLVFLPLCGLLVLSVARRVGDYGWTLERVALAACTLWSVATSLWFATGPRRPLAAPVAFLALLAVLLTLPGIGAAALSERSQVARLERLLESRKAAPAATDSLRFERDREINDIVEYLSDWHDGEGLDGFCPKDTLGIGTRKGRSDRTTKVLACLDVPRVGRYQNWNQTSQRLYLSWEGDTAVPPLDLTGYRRFGIVRTDSACKGIPGSACLPFGPDTLRLPLDSAFRAWSKKEPSMPVRLETSEATFLVTQVNGGFVRRDGRPDSLELDRLEALILRK